jgi:hypothetical protein
MPCLDIWAKSNHTDWVPPLHVLLRWGPTNRPGRGIKVALNGKGLEGGKRTLTAQKLVIAAVQ